MVTSSHYRLQLDKSLIQIMTPQQVIHSLKYMLHGHTSFCFLLFSSEVKSMQDILWTTKYVQIIVDRLFDASWVRGRGLEKTDMRMPDTPSAYLGNGEKDGEGGT